MALQDTGQQEAHGAEDSSSQEEAVVLRAGYQETHGTEDSSTLEEAVVLHAGYQDVLQQARASSAVGEQSAAENAEAIPSAQG